MGQIAITHKVFDLCLATTLGSVVSYKCKQDCLPCLTLAGISVGAVRFTDRKYYLTNSSYSEMSLAWHGQDQSVAELAILPNYRS